VKPEKELELITRARCTDHGGRVSAKRLFGASALGRRRAPEAPFWLGVVGARAWTAMCCRRLYVAAMPVLDNPGSPAGIE
jgi:hypothetical protein